MNDLLIERQRNVHVCKLKLLLLNCARWTSLALKMVTSKLNILGGNNKTVVWSAACLILIYLARENRYWAQLMLRPISALPCQINQISDSSRPNNCILLYLIRNSCSLIGRLMIDIMLPRKPNICRVRDIMLFCKTQYLSCSFRKVILRRVVCSDTYNP